MTVNKVRKTHGYRGSKTHGGGSMKKRRGAGNRGGRGMAGTGKRADTKRILILKKFGHEYFGKKGFKRPRKAINVVNTINIGYLDNQLDRLVEQKLVAKKGDFYEVDLAKIGCHKLLGKGDLTHKIKLSASMISKTAMEKVKKAGGEIIGAEDVSTS